MVNLGKVHQAELPQPELREEKRAAFLLEVARRLFEVQGLDSNVLQESRLFGMVGASRLSVQALNAVDEYVKTTVGFTPAGTLPRSQPVFNASSQDQSLLFAHRLGEALDLLLAHEKGDTRRKIGSYYTPVSVARSLIERALSQGIVEVLKARRVFDEPSEDSLCRVEAGKAPLFSFCDPACGGGAFLLEAAAQINQLGRAMMHQRKVSPAPAEKELLKLRVRVAQGAFGVDTSALAIAVAELALFLFVGDINEPIYRPEQFVVGDALVGEVREESPDESRKGLKEGPPPVDFFRAFPKIFSSNTPQPKGFDWVVGNPPWIAFQGRATQKISLLRRSFYRKNFRAFSGYPTLHGLFIERGAALAPQGFLTLLVPSSVSDLDGYRATRTSLREAHTPCEPLLEFGQDAFEGVVQPCFGLIARPRTEKLVGAVGAPFLLEERTKAGGVVKRTAPPKVLKDLESLSVLPPETFREMGFQSNRIVAENLFYRGEVPQGDFQVPLLEGRNVGEFEVRSPRLFLKSDQATLKSTRCRLRDLSDYEGVDAVVRQTAAFTIAARHNGGRFRNSLIAAFATTDVDTELLVGLLNSALFRALHIGRQRDARQAAFPQVKVGHLRKLPAPPSNDVARERVREFSRGAVHKGGMTQEERQRFDQAVFDLFEISSEGAIDILAYLNTMAPRALKASCSVSKVEGS